MTGDRPPDPTASSEEDPAKIEAPADGGAPEAAPPPVEDAEAPREAPEQEAVADPVPAPGPEAADAGQTQDAPPAEPVPAPPAPEEPAPGPEAADAAVTEDAPTTDPAPAAPAPGITESSSDPDPEAKVEAPKDEVGAAAAAAAPEAKPKPAPKPRAKRPPRPREPLPWPELRAAAALARDDADVEELKELFRLLPNDVRDETVEGVREYRKGARRPVSAYAGKALARAVHTARRARRSPDSDDAVSEAMGQALAAEVIASLDVEVAAEVILPKRDLLERESRNARRRQKAEDDRSRDERRRRAREENSQQGAKDGTYSGAKIRGLDQLAKLFDNDGK